ncbi:MAG: hypothetical protein ABIJ97_10680 [Bacteroidota bacterium]
MVSVVLTSESKADLSMLIILAKKLGIKIYRLTKSEAEDMTLINAMEPGSTGEKCQI